MCAGVVVVQIDVRGLDRELAAVRHGVAGVDHEVHDHLLDLSRIGIDAAQLRIGSLVLSSMSSPISRRSMLLHAGDHGVQVEDLGLQHLPAAEREQLPGERGGPVACLHDLIDRSPVRILRTQAVSSSWP